MPSTATTATAAIGAVCVFGNLQATLPLATKGGRTQFDLYRRLGNVVLSGGKKFFAVDRYSRSKRFRRLFAIPNVQRSLDFNAQTTTWKRATAVKPLRQPFFARSIACFRRFCLFPLTLTKRNKAVAFAAKNGKTVAFFDKKLIQRAKSGL